MDTRFLRLFIIVFVFKDIAKEFNTDIPSVSATLFLTLAMRPLGTETSRLEADRVDLAKELLALELRGVAALTDR